ncbi:MAG: ROK family protein [Sarcina sp.]
MNIKYFVAIDVGGTFIKSAVIDSDGNILSKGILINESYAKESKERIITNLIEIIEERINSFKDKIFSAIGIAFPGPFDYEKGISYIQGIDKYESIYGVNIKSLLLDYFKKNSKNTSTDFQINFENDGVMFGLGEYLQSLKKDERIFTLCIGTGAGSAYIENGKIIKEKLKNIKNGWIYNVPYKGSIIDDYISSRGILKIANEKGIKGFVAEEISQLALGGDEKAKEVWEEFGENLREVLILVTKDFQPNKIVIGGQISKSYTLFIKCSESYFSKKQIPIEISKDTSVSIIKGAIKIIK